MGIKETRKSPKPYISRALGVYLSGSSPVSRTEEPDVKASGFLLLQKRSPSIWSDYLGISESDNFE